MACRYFQVISLLLLILTSCQDNSKAPQVTINSTVENGDLILRREGGFISSLFSSVASDDKTFSHIGILTVNEKGEVGVIHCEMKESKEPTSLRLESLPLFLAKVDTLGIFRLQMPDTVRKKVAEHAITLLNKGATFDFDFNNETDSALYCTEFVAKTINRAVDSTLVQPTKFFAGKIGYSLDDITKYCDRVH